MTALCNRLAGIVADSGVALRFLPRVNLACHSISAMEVLVQCPAGIAMPIPPSQFMRNSEGFALADALMEWILEEGCRMAAQWTHAGTPLKLSVSVPRPWLSAANAQRLAAVLVRTNFDAERLELRLSALPFSQWHRHSAELCHLAALGVRLSLGHGAPPAPPWPASRDMLFDALMIRERGADNHVRATVTAAHEHRLRVVVDRVTERCQLERLRALGCDEAQGPAISGALAPHQVTAYWRFAEWGVGALCAGRHPTIEEPVQTRPPPQD